MAYLKNVKSTSDSWKKSKADLVVFGIFKDHSMTKTGNAINSHLDNAVTMGIDCSGIKGKEGECHSFFGKKHRFLLLGLGDKKKFNTESIRKAGGSASKFALKEKCPSLFVESFHNKTNEIFSRALTEGLILGSYQFRDYFTQDDTDDEKPVFLDNAVIINGNDSGISRGTASAQSVCLARDLGNHPGNVTTPSYLADKGMEIAKNGGMKCSVFEREKFTKMGMGALAGVALGSDEPPKFILLEYFGGKNTEKPICLVGKGLTFDSGGISIKPSNKMDEMKYDMCGSAVVLGVMNAVAEIKPKMNVIAAISSTENLSGAKAYKPGDILTAYNGKTIEVLNTDAEGRLILADALSYISKHYDPEYILDFATLTGAVIVALGHIATGIMGTDKNLISKVKKSSKNTSEKVWEFPLWDEYCKQVKSKIADVKNLGAPGQAGSIAGGAFLKSFVGDDIPWVHFDIAGTAWGADEKSYTQKNSATGAVIRLVLDLLGV